MARQLREQERQMFNTYLEKQSILVNKDIQGKLPRDNFLPIRAGKPFQSAEIDTPKVQLWRKQFDNRYQKT